MGNAQWTMIGQLTAFALSIVHCPFESQLTLEGLK